jgi:hypothetical protein
VPAVLEDLLGGEALQLLPQEEDALHMARSYLDTVNRVLPIFDPEELLRLVHDQYGRKESVSLAAWTALNAVFALGTAHKPNRLLSQAVNAQKYYDRAALVSTRLLFYPTDLLSVQALLTMVYIYSAYLHQTGFKTTDSIVALCI